MRIFTLLLALLLSTSIFAGNKSPKHPPQTEFTDEIFPRTDPKLIGMIYQMLKVIDMVFTEHEITYWIDSGTVLGAVRHQGIIPWDDDADLVFHIEDQDRILALADEFASYGLSLRQDDIIRIFPSKTSTYPYVDLVGFSLGQNNIYRYYRNWPPATAWKNFYWHSSEVTPLVRVPFGPITLNAPNEMTRYLFTGYGTDCLLYATYQTPHGGTKESVTQKKVRIVDFNPAPYEITNFNIPLD